MNNSIEKEIWKDVVGYEGIYEVSNIGKVRSVSRHVTHSDGAVQFFEGKERSLRMNRDGYKYVSLYRNRKEKRIAVHRLVAISFIPNPENKSQVNHIDGDKLNNEFSNLEWVTPKENMKHALKMDLINKNSVKRNKHLAKLQKKNRRPVIQKDLKGNLIKRHESIRDAAEYVKNDRNKTTCIGYACQGKLKTAYGYMWEYA